MQNFIQMTYMDVMMCRAYIQDFLRSDHSAIAMMYYKFKGLNIFTYLHMVCKLPVLFKPAQLFYLAI